MNKKEMDFIIDKLIGAGIDLERRVDNIEDIRTPKCILCKELMVNAIDSKTKKLSPYLWKTTCEHMKGKLLSIG